MKEVTHTKTVKTDGKGFPWFSIAVVLLVLGGIAFAMGWVDSGKYQPVQPTQDTQEIAIGGLTRLPNSDFSAKTITSDGNLTVTGTIIQNSVSSRPVQASIISTTTILAKIQNPFSATSTMSNIACNVTTSTSTQTVISAFIAETLADTFGTSTNGTALVSKTIASGQLNALYVADADNKVIGGSQWIVFGYDTGSSYSGTTLVGATNAAFKQAGTCSGRFYEI